MPLKDIDFKWERVRAHYEKAYATEFKKRPDDEKIEYLYNKMVQLKWDEQNHFERKPALRLLIDNSCQEMKTVVNDAHDGSKAG